MLFTFIILVALAATFTVVKFSKSKTQDSCCAHPPAEEVELSTTPEESHVEVETVPTVEVVPTTPSTAPTMTAKKKKKPQPKKKPAKAKVNA